MSAAVSGRMLNVGCGLTFHADWVNLDVAPADASIMRWDVKRGLPFGDEAFDAVYCSHLLEHLARGDARRLMVDCHRVLKPGGIARFVVPDLEAIAREYLRLVDALRDGREVSTNDYEWIVLELLDQVARERSGGEVAPFLRKLDPGERRYVLSRIGEEARRAWSGDNPVRVSRWARLAQLGISQSLDKVRSRVAVAAVRLLAGRHAATALQAGLFRQSGEVHRWMYDEFSLAWMLRDTGFAGVSRCAADASGIPRFAAYMLDTDAQGVVRKPDSLFVEGKRPVDSSRKSADSGPGGFSTQ